MQAMPLFKHSLLIGLFLWSFQVSALVPFSPLKVPLKTLPKENVIYRGIEVSVSGETWKSVVQLSFANEDGSGNLCTGTLLQKNVILTAAHCINNIDAIMVSFFEGSKMVDSKVFGKGEFHARRNPRYAPSNFGVIHDMAIIVFKEPLYSDDSPYKALNIIDASLASAISIGSKVYVSGAGNTSLALSEAENDKLFFASGLIHSYPTNESVKIIIGNGLGVCGGDSGSPVMVKVGGTFYIAGVAGAVVTNMGPHCGYSLYGSFITAADYEWILKETGQAFL